MAETTKTLFFIPDISGFTKFVNATEISHSQHIISELLELLIDSNQIGLEVSEIEGDAIFFYRHGELPDFKDITGQVKKMFVNFHNQLKKYELFRLCQCAACKSADGLTLKILTHYGEAGSYKVKEHEKLIGKDVILVHRLLKNSIDHHEYVLLTDEMMKSVKGADTSEDWLKFTEGSDSYDEFGKIKYKYSYLSSLLDLVKIEEPEDKRIPNPYNALTLSIDINAPAEKVFETLIDLPNRSKWMDGIKEVVVYDNQPNHIGTVHKCIRDGKEPDLVTTMVNITDNLMEFWETDPKQKLGCKYSVKKLSDNYCSATLEFQVKNNFVFRTVVNLFMKKKIENNVRPTIENLKKLCEGTFEGKESELQPALSTVNS